MYKYENVTFYKTALKKKFVFFDLENDYKFYFIKK